jgi:CBS domain-containing protein
MKNTTVKNIMTKDIITINANENLSKAGDLMDKNHFRHLPVVEGDKLIGILSKTDLLRLGFNDRMGELESQIGANLYDVLNVGQVMVAHPMFISESMSIAEASQKMIEEEFHALPVVDDENKLAGILTSSDALRFFIEN